MSPFSQRWQPTKIRRVIVAMPTGAEVVQVETDVGRAFAKFLGGREGPHVLACELVGTRMAALLGLPVFDACLLSYPGIPEIVLSSGNFAKPGTAWLTRRVEGIPWSLNASDLKFLANPADIAKLVLLDQWIRNCDRYRPAPLRINANNVFLMREGAPEGRFTLVAMDHTHAFTCGRPLGRDLEKIDWVKDETAFGLFPEFVAALRREDALAAVESLKGISPGDIETAVAEIPSDWEVGAAEKASLCAFLRGRREWLAAEFVTRLFPQGELFDHS